MRAESSVAKQDKPTLVGSTTHLRRLSHTSPNIPPHTLTPPLTHPTPYTTPSPPPHPTSHNSPGYIFSLRLLLSNHSWQVSGEITSTSTS